jgi:REP element-mobilizing transposase RayT
VGREEEGGGEEAGGGAAESGASEEAGTHFRHPVHVTLRARGDVPSLRADVTFGAVMRALIRGSKGWFRVVHFSVQVDHVHLIVEADGDLALIRGVQGLAVRCAKAINRELGRRGAVWGSRYHARGLTTPREVRTGLAYVLLNFRKHMRVAQGIDPRSSGRWFDGWARWGRPRAGPRAAPRTWLIVVGWRRAGGAIEFDEGPRPERAATGWLSSASRARQRSRPVLRRGW